MTVQKQLIWPLKVKRNQNRFLLVQDGSRTVFIYVMMVVLFLHRVLTVHGSDDSVVRVEEALGFAKVILNHKQHDTTLLEVVSG